MTEIRSQLKQLLHGWTSGETAVFDTCVAEDPYIYFSTYENCYSREALKMMLTREDDMQCEMKIINEMSRTYGDKAAQYATIIGSFTDGNDQLLFGGSFSNKLQKQGETWMFTEMRFELQMDNATKSYTLDAEGHVHAEEGPGREALLGNWKRVNTAIGLFVDPVPGQGEHTIMPEFDAPWYLIPEQDTQVSDAEQIQDQFLRYMYAFDFYTPDLMDGVFAEDLEFHSNQAGILQAKDAANYLTLVRQASARSFHAVIFEEMQVQGSQATVRATRLCPELAEDFDNLQAGEYTLHFTKNNTWQIDRFAYQPTK